jgi:hypothetical protein
VLVFADAAVIAQQRQSPAATIVGRDETRVAERPGFFVGLKQPAVPSEPPACRGISPMACAASWTTLMPREAMPQMSRIAAGRP